MIGCQIPAFCPLNFNHLDCDPRSQKLHRNYTRLVNFEINNPQITIVTESSRKSIQSLVRYVCWLSNYQSVFVSHPSHPQFEGRRPAQSQWKPFKDSQCWSVCQAWHWLRQAENSNSYEPLSTGTHFFGTWLLPAPPEIHLCPRWIVQTARASTWEVKWWNRVPNSPHFMQHVRITKFKLRYQWTVKSIFWYLGKGSPQCQKLGNLRCSSFTNPQAFLPKGL